MNTNKSTIVVITTSVAIMAFLCVCTICILSYYEIKVASELNTLTATLCGALIAMLVKTSPTEATKQPVEPPPNGGSLPTQVEVVNQPTDPVPTVETK